jgi:Uma2 family endonuclease
MNRSMPTDTAPSFAAYLDFEEHSLEKHEFVEGQLFVMANETDSHNRIAGRIYAQLLEKSEASGCRIYFNGVKVRTPDETGYIPDVFISCDQSDHNDPRVKRSPCFIVEVASPSTEAIDRGEKLHRYQTIPSLQMYAIFAQNEIIADIYSRLSDDSWQHRVLKKDAILRVECIQHSLVFEQVYRGIL